MERRHTVTTHRFSSNLRDSPLGTSLIRLIHKRMSPRRRGPLLWPVGASVFRESKGEHLLRWLIGDWQRRSDYQRASSRRSAGSSACLCTGRGALKMSTRHESVAGACRFGKVLGLRPSLPQAAAGSKNGGCWFRAIFSKSQTY